MKGNCYNYVKVPGILRFQAEEFVFDRVVPASSKTISAHRAGEAGPFIVYVRFIQCIIFAIFNA